MSWGLFRDKILVEQSNYVIGLFIGPLRSSFSTHVHLFSLTDIFSEAFVPKNVPFECFRKSLSLQKQFLCGHPWESNETVCRCIDIVLSGCKSWHGFFALPIEKILGVDVWFFSHSHSSSNYIFFVPCISPTDDESFLHGFDLLKRASDYENKLHGVYSFEFSDFEIRKIGSSQVA